jgi:hypothetical protein
MLKIICLLIIAAVPSKSQEVIFQDYKTHRTDIDAEEGIKRG